MTFGQPSKEGRYILRRATVGLAYKRDLTEQEEQDIERMGAEIAARCEDN